MLRTRLIGAVLGMAGLLLLAIHRQRSRESSVWPAQAILSGRRYSRTPEVQKELKLTRSTDREDRSHRRAGEDFQENKSRKPRQGQRT